jgi:hypothetical protein
MPPDDAGPRQIRQYLVDHFMSKHDTTLEFAQKTADLWQLGRGSDFRLITMYSTEVAMKKYTVIFGDAVAPYLLRSVREDCWNQWRASTLGTISLWTIITCITISFVCGIWTLRSDRFAKVAYAFKNSCLPIGPPILICAYLEHGHSPAFPVLCWLLGIYGTFAEVVSFLIVKGYM